LQRLAHIVIRAGLKLLHARFSGGEAGFGGIDIFGATAALHVGQTALLLCQRGGRLRQGQVGSALVEDRQRVARLYLGAGVDEQVLDLAGGFRCNTNLFARTDLAVIRQDLLDRTAMCAVGGDTTDTGAGVGVVVLVDGRAVAQAEPTSIPASSPVVTTVWTPFRMCGMDRLSSHTETGEPGPPCEESPPRHPTRLAFPTHQSALTSHMQLCGPGCAG
jgi:hypothetical protein